MPVKALTRNTTSQPLDAEYARLHRILQIIQLIQQQNGWDAKALARACAVTQRTIYRDLKLLEGANIPFSYDDERRCYGIRPDFFMRPVELSLDEALALVALGEEIGKKEQIPFTMAAARAVAKIRGQLPEKVRRELKAIDQHMAIRLSEAGASDGVAGRNVLLDQGWKDQTRANPGASEDVGCRARGDRTDVLSRLRSAGQTA